MPDPAAPGSLSINPGSTWCASLYCGPSGGRTSVLLSFDDQRYTLVMCVRYETQGVLYTHSWHFVVPARRHPALDSQSTHECSRSHCRSRKFTGHWSKETMCARRRVFGRTYAEAGARSKHTPNSKTRTGTRTRTHRQICTVHTPALRGMASAVPLLHRAGEPCQCSSRGC